MSEAKKDWTGMWYYEKLPPNTYLATTKLDFYRMKPKKRNPDIFANYELKYGDWFLMEWSDSSRWDLYKITEDMDIKSKIPFIKTKQIYLFKTV